jgi:mannose-1-phosphate guanylyltransferase
MRPLTELYPKPALPVLGTPSFEVIVEKLLRTGASTIHCNLFHLPGPLLELIGSRNWPLTVHLEESLLGTGGGIGYMAGALQSYDTILLHNGDIISNIELEPVIAFHRSRGSLFTMVLASKGPPPSVAVASGGEVTGIGSKAGSGGRKLGYTGIALLSPEALRFFTGDEQAELVPILKRMIHQRPGSVAGFETDDDTLWAEIGSPAGYLSLHRRILVGRECFDPMLEPPPLPLFVSDSAMVDPGSEWQGFLSVQSGAHLERNSRLEDCVVLEGARVLEGEHHTNSILFRNGVVTVNQ